MIWCEKVALTVWGTFMALSLLMGASNPQNPEFLPQVWAMLAIYGAGFWIVLRVIDIILSGPMRRKMGEKLSISDFF